ncbi:hypothetical protein H257_04601 [Aphanomyces astaci]|uniref:Uncharacterized protein n=1 Tax=Aphanomyces astaci TaxID=112090 RepID=W4GU23_APHAT|nr:hypothetical protein H257_04601 [Aphanomyces astaci]ETV82821.1 hypothetical protein H257_04601 [Aphanomyces astaci]RQM31256.1 hypothetical protein B5M09_004320 [Aphanomyces astaci]|eukprot:XP_009827492.1 hypothetical protein H257_04601 [Aphanomyces astaci]
MDSAFMHEEKTEFDFNDLVLGSMGDAAGLENVLSEDSLDDGSSSSSTTAAGLGKKRKYVNRQKLELEYLRDTVDALQKQMDFLGNMQANQQQTGSEWKDLAAEQQLQAQLAFVENARLRTALQEELAFAETLAGIVRKKPKVLDLPSTSNNAWRDFKLVADIEARNTAIHAIADREYNKVLHNVLQSDAADSTSPSTAHQTVKSTTVKYLDDGIVPGIVIESFNRLMFPHVPFHILGHALWSFLNGDIGDVSHAASGSSFDQLDSVGDDVVYMKSRWRIGNHNAHSADKELHAESRLLIKRYVEPSRQIVVWRNIIEDALLPLDASALTFHGSGWAMVEHDTAGTIVKFFTEISTPLTHATSSPSVASAGFLAAGSSGHADDAAMLTSVSDDASFQVGRFTDSILSAYRNAYRRFEHASMQAWSQMQKADVSSNLTAFGFVQGGGDGSSPISTVTLNP